MAKTTKKDKWYIVWQGRVPGIYTTWEECKREVLGEKGAVYKSFEGISKEEATQILKSGAPKRKAHPKKQTKEKNPPPPPSRIKIKGIAVDASCKKNPGEMEYRGVWIETGEVLFSSEIYPKGTNNIGEFLAIVHAMALQEKSQERYTIYSDSRTAISWIKKQSIKTTLPENSSTQKLWNHIQRALTWLKAHDLSQFDLQKWDTEKLGEIPADYGRK